MARDVVSAPPSSACFQLLACQRCHETEPVEAAADIRLWPRHRQRPHRQYDAHDCPAVGDRVVQKASAPPGQKSADDSWHSDMVIVSAGPWRVTCHEPVGAGSAGMGFDMKFADLLREFVEWALNRCVADDIGDR